MQSIAVPLPRENDLDLHSDKNIDQPTSHTARQDHVGIRLCVLLLGSCIPTWVKGAPEIEEEGVMQLYLVDNQSGRAKRKQVFEAPECSFLAKCAKKYLLMVRHSRPSSLARVYLMKAEVGK